MIQGKNYEHFALDVLAPYFSSKIEESLEKIVNFNSHVKEQLGPKKSLKMKSIKPYGCPQCNVKTKTPSDLKVHMKSCHSKPSINSPKRNKIMRVLNEDISIVTVDKDHEHESVTNTLITSSTTKLKRILHLLSSFPLLKIFFSAVFVSLTPCSRRT